MGGRVGNTLEKLANAEAWLAEAKTVDDFKKIHDVAEMAQHLGRGTAMEAYGLEVRMVAARRIGELMPAVPPEISGRMAHEEVAEVRLPEIPHQRLSEFRKLGGVSEEALRNAVRKLASSEDVRLSWSAAVHLAMAGTPMLQSISNDWYTPDKYIESVREVLGDIDLDPASCEEANEVVKAKVFYDESDDGLSLDATKRIVPSRH